MRVHLLVASLAVAGSLLLSACDESDPVDPSGSGETITATITHEGFDFSANVSGFSQEYDGETVSWQPGAAANPAYPRDQYVWWRPATGGTMDMGTVTLASVTQAPSAWEASPNITPLLAGHVYVARCADGYVKFRVNSVNPSGDGWPAEVEYQFSSSASFQ